MDDVLLDDIMVDDFLKSLTIDKLEGDALELAQVIGMDAFRNLVSIYGGSGYLYIPQLSTLRASARNQNIQREYYEGARVKDLARKYHLSTRQISAILQGERTAHKGEASQ